MNEKLLNFYVKQSNPQYQSSCLKMIASRKAFDVKGFVNVHFKGYIGVKHKSFDFTLVDLLMMNPYDWIIILVIISRYHVKYEPIIHILRGMIKGYIQEVSKINVEVGKVLNRKLIMNPMDQPKNHENINVWFIQKEHLGVIYKTSKK